MNDGKQMKEDVTKVFINYWDAEDWKSNTEIEQVKDKNESVILTGLLQGLEFNAAKMSTIELETVNRCNNDCSFCPVSRKHDIRKTIKMSEDLFKKIIGDLEEMQYDGTLCLFSNNEPLLDDRVYSFLKYAREKLPNAILCLYTNGILLTEERYIQLVEYLDYLVIDNYNDEIALNDNIRELKEKNIDEKNCCVRVDVRKKNQILANRGGLSPNNENKNQYVSPCVLPFIQMVIRPDGKVSRCCQDVYGNETMGDLSEQSIQDVWQGEKFRLYREMMLEGKRCNIEYCRDCDIKGLFGQYPNEWLHLYYERLYMFIHQKWKQHRRIVFCGVKEANHMIYVLCAMGIAAECSTLKSDIQYYAEEKCFMIIGQLDEETLDILKENNLKIGEDFVLCQYSLVEGRKPTRRTLYEIEMIHRLIEASDNEQLMVFGAGINGIKLIEAFQLKPIRVFDSFLVGNYWNGYKVEKPENIPTEDDSVILVTPSKYVELVQQLNALNISSNRIIIGRFLMDLM